MIINELGMREISAEEARKIGVDLTYVGVCKKLRKLAKLDRLQLDETMHRNNLNISSIAGYLHLSILRNICPICNHT